MRYLWVTALSLGCILALAQDTTRNMLYNSGFELGRPADLHLKGWTVPSAAAGVTYERVTHMPHSGTHCARITVAPETPVSWYQLFQRVTGWNHLRRYTLSAWLRTENMHDGAGAYISLSCHDTNGRRLGFRDSAQHLQGTTGWTRIWTTSEVFPGTTELRAILVVHGHGMAYFDDVQLEEGDAPTDYNPGRSDRQAAAAEAENQSAARRFFEATGYTRHPGQDVAILRDTFPRLGAPSDPALLAAVLETAGYHVTFLQSNQLANPFIADPNRFDLVVLPYGRAFPAVAREAFQEYLALGGCLLSMGGYAFDEQVVKGPDGWQSPQSLPRTPGPQVSSLLDFESGLLDAWSTGAGPQGSPPQLACDETDPGQGARSLRFRVHGMQHWATAVSPPLPPERFFAGWSELLFRARGDAATPRLVVEWHERDGTRWKTQVDLDTQWHEYVLVPTDFRYWPDSTSVGRGGHGDAPRLDNMERLLFGLSTEIVPNGGNYTFWVDDIRIADDPLAALRIAPVCMNTRYCRIQDAMWPEAEQIGVFDPSHPLKGAVTARFASHPGMGLPRDAKLRGPFQGFAAVGVLSTQGHGFGPDNARLVPILESFDDKGRPRGALGSLMFHFAGHYRGSAWGFFGVENQDLFSDRYPEVLNALPGIVRVLVERLFLFGTEAQYNCYRPGEPVRLRVNVANFGHEPRACTLRLELSEFGKPAEPLQQFARDLAVMPGVTETVEFDWRAPDQGADLYLLHSSLAAGIGQDARQVDEEENAVVVWRDEVVARGPKPTIRDTYFYQAGLPRYLVGCQNWWGTNGSLSQRRPLDFERDFAMMQDLGLHLSRCFLPWQTEEQKRTSDAWVYLAQKHNIVLFHTPNLAATADPELLAQETAAAQDIARRYRDVPGLIVDTCNETGVHADDSPGQRGPFNQWLQVRYGSDEALRQAWADDPPERLLPEVPFRWPTQRWESRRARDVSRFAVEALCRWATETRNAFRSQRPDLAVTPGWGQGFGWGAQIFDPPLASRDQDFTNQHYYGELRSFPLYMKPLDRRWAGQPWTVGECGAKQHPSYPDGETEEQYNRRFLYIQHHAFGMGMAFAASWHWRDPLAGIFPCGLVHADFTLREAALIERNQSLLFSHLHPKYQPPRVFLLLPDGHRLGGAGDLTRQLIHTAVDTLLGLHVPFECLCEADLPHLPPTCEAIIWPMPYCPSDATFESVLQFVQAGGSLLVTGDVGYDEDRQWTRAERVRRLTGAQQVTRRYEGLRFATVPLAEISSGQDPAASRLPPYQGRPSLSLQGADGTILTHDDQGAVATLRALGRGQVMFVAEPLELESEVPRREYYATFLNLAACHVNRAPSATAPLAQWRLSMQPDRPDIHVFRFATLEGGEIIVAHNGGQATRLTVAGSTASMELDLAPMLPGMCALDGQGQPLLAEAQGEVRANGALAVKSTGHAAVIALDGKPLGSSEELLILPFEPCTVTIPRALRSPLAAQCGEVSGGRWRSFDIDVSLRPLDGAIEITCGPATRLEMILLTTQGNTADAGAKVVERLTE